MFEKTLQDVVKGIRANKRDPSDYISATIAEIKFELRSSDAFVKAQAIRKLTYLQMLGYDMSWAAFYVIEVMTMPRFAHKRVGYLAANQCFTEDTEVVLLCTNHLQKEFKSQNPYDVGLAINCLANIATPGLSRDLISDLVQLLGNHKPYVRKKALLAMYKLFIKYPQGLRLTFDRIKERLEDSDSSVVSCAVNVICELADKNPKNYLAMAPQFFRLLTTSSNNWMLIKVVKLLGSLVPEEPRLARKLLEPLATIIQNTAAKSLLYECIHTMTLALPFTRKADGTESKAVPAAVRLCSEHLRKFTEDPDQNLKYLGLVGFVNLMRSHPRAVAEHRALVLACLSDDDVTIRTRALELLTGMVTKRNLEDLVLNLLQHVARAEGTYRDELIAKIILVCSRDKYAYLSNFRWYTGVLIDLSRVEGSKHGDALALQLTDVSLRVEEVREYALHKSVGLLLEPSLISGRSFSTMQQVLGAAAWIVGEYCRPHLETVAKNHRRGQRVWFDVVQALLAPEASKLPPRTQGVYVQNALKVLIAMCHQEACPDDGELGRTLDMVPGRLRALMRSPHMEVQERASTMYHLLVSYGVAKEEEEEEGAGSFQPGEEPIGANGGASSSSSSAAAKGKAKSGKEKETKGGDNGQAAAPVVLDLLGMDPNPSESGGGGAANGGASVEGEGANEPGDAPLMLTAMAPLPSMMGPVGAARGAASEMAALCGEVLKPVNQRAQSRVPPPDDVDLSCPVDGSALDRLLAFEYDGPTDLAQLSFTQVRAAKKSDYEEYRVFGDNSAVEKDGGGGGSSKRSKKSSRKNKKDKDRRNHSGSGSGAGSPDRSNGNGMLMLGAQDDDRASLGSPLANGGGRGRKSSEDRYKSDPFYLGGKGGGAARGGGGGADIDDLRDSYYGGSGGGGGGENSTALALIGGGGDSFDDEYAGGTRSGGKGRKGKRDKGKRGRGGKGEAYAVDKVEMMPASAVIDSEDDEPAGGRGGATLGGAGTSSGLAAIDITTPLEEDEIMPEVKPYVRLTAETAKGSGGGDDRAKEKEHKHKKKTSSSTRERSSKSRKASGTAASSSTSSKKKSKKGEPAASGSAEVDLIGWGAGGGGGPASPTAAPAVAVAAGTAMRAPPPASASSMGTWESDLSAILSAAAPVAAPAPAVAPTAMPAAGGAWADGGNPAAFLGDLGGAAGGGGGARDGRRRSDKEKEGSSNKTRKDKSSKKSSSSKSSSKDKKKRSRG